MFPSVFTAIILSAGFSAAAPLNPRAVTLDQAAVAEAQVRDPTATRAFSATTIKTSDGSCLSVDPLSGDFRENLTPVQVKACDGTPNQQWDVITAGKHITSPGAALFVSALTQACLNFDPRRAAGNQVLLFSCGGRADGGGLATDSQAFTFAGGNTAFPLTPLNGNNAVCLTVKGAVLDQTACTAATASGAELFTIGAAGAAAPATPAKATKSAKPAKATKTAKSVQPASTSAAAPASTSGAATLVTLPQTTLDQAATAEAQVRDDTATRAFSSTAIKTSDGSCLFIDPLSGDFRENLTPVQVKPCDGSPNQQFDVITAGKHITTPGAALIVSSLTQSCLNFDPRRAAGNQVLMFSCGGRADGGGLATDSQAFAFSGGKAPFALAPVNGNNAVCLTVKGDLLDQTACTAAAASGAELFTIAAAAGGAAPAAPAAPATSAAAPASSAAAAAPTSAPAATTTASATSTQIAVSRAGSVLNPSAAAEANPRDDTATRALSSVQVKTSDNQCLDIDPNAGDFRENLIPVTIKACDAASPNQKFDVITAGKHNNVAGAALIVSSLTQGCLNFDPRRAAGDQVLLFSCGGRADGGGAVTNSQLFDFKGGNGPLPLVPQNGNEALCLFDNAGKLDSQSCTPASATGSQLFSFA